MTEGSIILAKATNAEERSDSVVVSFASEWYQPLLEKQFSIVIRKRVPRPLSCRWLYFHINSPISAICGRAPIEAISEATTKEAIQMAKEISLRPDAIAAYIRSNERVGFYKLGPIQIIATPLRSEKLRAFLVYHPPQSFFILSKRAKEVVDQLAGLSMQPISHNNPGKQ